MVFVTALSPLPTVWFNRFVICQRRDKSFNEGSKSYGAIRGRGPYCGALPMRDQLKRSPYTTSQTSSQAANAQPQRTNSKSQKQKQRREIKGDGEHGYSDHIILPFVM
jgi:hypothetical protein